jgi:hypothetical protein
MLPLAARLAAVPLALVLAWAVRPDTSITVTGHITDAQSSAAIEGAQVLVSGSGLGAITDARGLYVLRLPASLRNTTVELQVRRIGYTTIARQVQLSAERVTMDFALTMVAAHVDVGVIAADESQATGAKAARIESTAAAPGRIAAAHAVPQGFIAARQRVLEEQFIRP